MTYIQETSISRDQAEQILKTHGVSYPDNADWYVAENASGTKFLVAWGYDEPFLDLEQVFITQYVGPEIVDDTTLAELQGDYNHYLVVECDFENATIDIYSTHNSQRNTWTVREHHGHVKCYRLEILSARDVRALIIELSAIVDLVHAAHDTEWNGQNHVAVYGWDAHTHQDYLYSIELTICNARTEEVGGLWDPAEWFEIEPPQLLDGESIEAAAARLQCAAHCDGVHLIDLEEYLNDLFCAAVNGI